MKEEFAEVRVNAERLRADFDELAKVGATGDGGVHRPALSVPHLEAREWFRERIEAAGLEFRVDGAGNHSALLSCGADGAPTLLLGSHLDSVPYGGRYDGALGVLAALEALRVVRESDISLPVHLEAIDFTDEEGTLVGLLGSAAVGGVLSAEVLRNPRGGRAALESGFTRAGLTEADVLAARRDPDSMVGYLELHIEQGSRLLDENAQIGVVTSIAGINSYRLAFLGRADHAGTSSMDQRRDAALGASAFTLGVRDTVIRDFPRCTANVGAMRFEPGAFNIVPARVEVDFEFRAPDAGTFSRLESALLSCAGDQADRFGLELRVKWLGRCDPAPMSEVTQRALRAAADALELRHFSLPSAAGHDGQSLVGVCPVGMVFVPSIEGASHSPQEFTPWEDCVNGANVLLHAALRLALDLSSTD
jgi:N-carbamoyl-L-amino-acid hydrolase